MLCRLLARLELIEATGVLGVNVDWVNGNYQRILFHSVELLVRRLRVAPHRGPPSLAFELLPARVVKGRRIRLQQLLGDAERGSPAPQHASRSELLGDRGRQGRTFVPHSSAHAACSLRGITRSSSVVSSRISASIGRTARPRGDASLP